MSDFDTPTESEIAGERRAAEVLREAVARREEEAARAAVWQEFVDSERAAAQARREARSNRGCRGYACREE